MSTFTACVVFYLLGVGRNFQTHSVSDSGMLSSNLRGVTLSNIIMTNSEQKLRKANNELKDEVAGLKVKLEKVLKELSEGTEECNLNVGNGREVVSSDKTKSVEFVSDQHDV